MYWGGGPRTTTFELDLEDKSQLYSAAAFKNSKITSGLTVLKRSCREGTW